MSEYIKVMSLIKREMNGAVSGSMSDYGINCTMNYGVSLPTIKSIASEFYPNHELAEDLYRQEIRDMRLAAVFIEDPMLIDLAQAQRWSKVWDNPEIAQVCAMELLCKSKDAYKIAKEWFGSDNELKHLASCHIVGKICSQINSSMLLDFISTRNNAYCLREIYKNHLDLRYNISKIANRVDDLAWQLEYL